MAESVDALVSNTSGETRPGSTPGLGTTDGRSDALFASERLFLWCLRRMGPYEGRAKAYVRRMGPYQGRAKAYVRRMGPYQGRAKAYVRRMGPYQGREERSCCAAKPYFVEK